MVTTWVWTLGPVRLTKGPVLTVPLVLEIVGTSGCFIVRSKFKKLLPGLGTGLRGRFGGELQIRNGYTDEYIVNMLLEVPIGLHFTELHIHADRACLLRAVRLAEACCRTLVDLLFSCVVCSGKSPPLPDLLVSLVLTSIH